MAEAIWSDGLSWWVMRKSDDEFNKKVARIGMACGAKTQKQLADILGISQASVSEAYKRRMLPSRWLLVLMEKYGVNPLWINSGKLPVMLEGLDDTAKATGFENGTEGLLLQRVPLKLLLEEIARRFQKM